MAENITSLVKTMAGDFGSEKDLKAYCNSQYIVINNQKEKLRQLEDEVKFLKDTIKTYGANVLVVSKEQAICEAQIEMLYKTAMNNPLDLDETKRLESIVKTLTFIKERRKDQKPVVPEESTEDLIALATK